MSSAVATIPGISFDDRFATASRAVVVAALRSAFNRGEIDGFDVLSIQLAGLSAALKHQAVRAQLIAVLDEVAVAVLDGK